MGLGGCSLRTCSVCRREFRQQVASGAYAGNKKAIGIDIGTTSVCGILIDAATGCVENSVTKNSNAFIEGCAGWEKIQSVDRIMGVATDIYDNDTDKKLGTFKKVDSADKISVYIWDG